MEPVAIIAVGAVLPDAPNATAFWDNVTGGRYSISEVDPARWDPALYYDPEPQPDKTYSKIGGWVRDFPWDPLVWKLPIPPKVSDAMDEAQKWAIACTRELLADHGREIDRERTAVILGNAMGGELHYQTNLRISAPEVVRFLQHTEAYGALPPDQQERLAVQLVATMGAELPPVTEDSMPGELANVVAGRIANLFNLRGPNYITDAACASAMAAMSAAVAGLNDHDFDTAITGGIDRNNGASSFIKFCAIGALSATGTRPFDAGADGFVMGEGAALFLLKRLADAERDGDRVYAVIRGIGGASDGKGKGITAPNPVGQRLAVERAWANAGISPEACTVVEAHGTSTRVGDVVEVGALGEAFAGADLPPHRIALGSVKSNIGHLKAGAGCAGVLKTALAIHHAQIPPSLNFETPNPNVDWSVSPFSVNTELREWTVPAGQVRTAGVSAFGFGGTNFHMVLEEYQPGRLVAPDAARTHAASVAPANASAPASAAAPEPKAPLRGAAVLGAADEAGLATRLRALADAAARGQTPPVQAPLADDLAAPYRVAIDFADAEDLTDKAGAALKAVDAPALWKPLRSRGVFRGQGPASGVAFLYPGQGSQYVDMLRGLSELDPIVARTYDEADAAMAGFIDRPLSSYILLDSEDPDRKAQAELELMATEITQPAMLTADEALTRLLAAYGITPDMVMGHSLGEYAALVSARSLTFAAALEAVSARGHEMASLDVGDPGKMAAVFAPVDEVQRIADETDGYVVLANVNSTSQSVLGGASDAVEAAVATCTERGFTTFVLPVSHAFHTRIVADASEPLRRTLERLELRAPELPVVSNVTGGFYPTGDDARGRMLELLAEQVASPVQFVSGLRSLREAGAEVFVEVGPKRALQGLASDVLGDDEVLNLFTNHPKFPDEAAFNQALCGLYAAGLGTGRPPVSARPTAATATSPAPTPPSSPGAPAPGAPAPTAPTATTAGGSTASTPYLEPAAMSETDRSYLELGRALGAFLERAGSLVPPAAAPVSAPAAAGDRPATSEPVVITGGSVGLPGTPQVFDDHQIARILGGEQFITPIPDGIRREIADRHITRLVKGDDGQASFETIDDPANVIKLAARSGALDLAAEFGIDADRVAALGWSTQLAIGAGVDALRDAGIPIVQHYRTTGVGSQLPERWGLPEDLRDDTGVIFASAFPGMEEITDEVTRYEQDAGRRRQRLELQQLRDRIAATTPDSAALDELDRELAVLDRRIADEAYLFNRRFLFRVLSMGHSQFAELIGARGPNTQINSACASTTQAVALAEDWIRAGRCRRVVVVAADDASSDELLPWIGAGFLATGAAATDERVEDAALPFDRRRHGMLIGMGAAGIVVEAAEAARERGITPICEVLGTTTANSAFHGTRLDVQHIGQVMEDVVAQAEARGVSRQAIAPETVFVSHETYTPARGGSAAAEIHALRQVFGPAADRIVIANTKGVTGHPMGVGVEDIVAIKALETGLVPPVPNFREVDPELGQLNLSRGGSYPLTYALRLAAGFGSQISMMLLRWTPVPDGQRRAPDDLGFAYRVTDPQAWHAWIERITGRPGAQLEVVDRWLRVVDTGPAARPVFPAATPVTIPAATAAPVAPAATATTAAPTAPAVAPAAAPPAVEEVPAGDPLEAAILELVAEQTGYPSDMLDLELDLEADLGIDTVKQAELFVAVRERFDIERDDSLQLRDYPSLSHVIGFVRDRAPADTLAALAPAAPPAAATPAAPAPSAAAGAAAPTAPAPSAAAGAAAPTAPAPAATDPVEAAILELVAEQTGYPSDMLDLELDLEADLGIDTVKQAELFVAVRERFDIERDDSLQLRDYPTLGHVIGFVRDRASADTLAALAPAAPPAVAVPATPAAPSAAAGAAAPTAPAPVVTDPVEAAILELVAEQTGYPPDMLDLELDLEADLGIDTVKQAELFVAVRERFDIERDDSLQLRDYPTLGHVIGFVRDRAPAEQLAALAPTPSPAVAVPATPAAPSAAAGAAAPAVPAPVVTDPVEAAILELVSEQTGYPPDMLDLELDLEADLGIDTVKQAELFVAVRERYDIERDDSLQLRDYPTLGHVIGFVRDRVPELAVAPAAEAPAASDAPAAAASEADAGAPAVTDPVEAAILELVSEQTGYPPDMLDLELDLEADLGIDTVKQAELFVAVRERYDIERDDSLQLRDYPTLGHVIGFVRDRVPELAVAPAAAAAAAAAAPTEEPTTATVTVDTSAFPRRVPVPVVRPAIDVCVPTGVALDGARFVVLPDHGGVADAVTAALEERGATVLTTPTAPSAEELEDQLAAWREEGPITGVLGLAGLDLAPFPALTAETWTEGLRVRVKLLATTARALYEDLGEGAAFVTGTRLGGRFGYDEAGAQDVLGGAVSGFTKALAREREDATVKVVDHTPDTDAATIAAHLIDELLADPGVIEVGYADGLRTSVGLDVQPTERDEDRALTPDDVFVITGAAGSIVSAITADLATGAGGGTFHLLDLTAEPDRDDADLARFVDDLDGLKADLAQRIKESGEKATPAKVNRALAGIERSRAALDNILAVEAAGGTAHWHQVDLTDGEAVGAAMAAATEGGRVDVLLHAGGLEISHFLPDKPAREYDLVFDVKADGLFHCLHGLGDAELGNLVVFSSVAGRFGNGGQTDYSAANDLLCKTVSALRTLRPGTRGIALDWTAWGGIGMATRGSIPKMMEFMGVDMLPPEIGIPIVRHELEAAGEGGESVVAGRLGLWAEEGHETGGVDAEALMATVGQPGPMLGEVLAVTLAEGVVTEVELDASQPFLDDHRIDGTPVVPGVMSLEGFAEVARLLVPDHTVVAVEDMTFDAPFKLYRDEPRRARISARLTPADDGTLVADCKLVGRRTLANGTEQVTEHATGRVVLAADAPEAPTRDVPATDVDTTVDAEAIYRIYFHGPTYQVLASAWSADGTAVGALADDLPPNHQPEDAPTSTAPRLLELCFQVAGVHELGTSHRMALPARIARLELFGPLGDDAPCWAVAVPNEDGADVEVVDADGQVRLRAIGYGTTVLPDGPDEELLAPLSTAMR